MQSVAESATTLTRERAGTFAAWLDRGIIIAIFLLAAWAPHSIAATQISWGIGLLLWIVRFFVKPRLELQRTPVDYALLGFFILSTVSSLFSYDPETSIGKLHAADLFTIVYLIAENIRSRRLVRALAVTLIASCMISVVYTAAERVVGRGVKLEGIAVESPLSRAGLQEGDTILGVDGRKVSNPGELVSAIATPTGCAEPGTAQIDLYRHEILPKIKVRRNELLTGPSALGRVGASDWSRGRDWRASGFYGHYVTYAEALQLIASLAVGLFIALRRKRSLYGVLLLAAMGGFCFSLLLTVTRASLLSFLISATIIVLVGASRRTIFILAACAAPLVLAGLFLLQQKRQVGFFDRNDDSITWRETVQREGLHLLVSNPRHLLVGVGMDSIKRYWREWGLFEGGIPMGHMHSDYLQIALERGIPAFIAWLLLVGVYARMLWRLLRNSKLDNWLDRGIILGALGGLVGFMSSGLVHYNWGDSEVVMIFYLIMGLALVIEREVRGGDSAVQAEQRL